MRRIHATHLLTVTRDPQADTSADPYDTAPTEPGEGTPVVEDARVRFHERGMSGFDFIRSALGEEVTSEMFAEGDGTLVEAVAAGDAVSLAPILAGGESYSNMVVTGVSPVYARGARPVRAYIHLEDT